MAEFKPKIGKVLISPEIYPGTTITNQMPKLLALAQALVSTGEGWTIGWDNIYNSAIGCWVVLEREEGVKKAQLGLVFNRQDLNAGIHGTNHGYIDGWGFYIWYKPSSSPGNLSIPYHPWTDPRTVDLCNNHNSFMFNRAQFGSPDMRTQHSWFTWLVDGERVVLLCEKENLHEPLEFNIFGPDIYTPLYNTGTAKWDGENVTEHPEPDENGAGLIFGYFEGDDIVWRVMECYKTDESLGSYRSAAFPPGYRNEFMRNDVANANPPFVQEPVVIYNPTAGQIWPAEGGSTGNSLKGLLDIDFVSTVNCGNGKIPIYNRLDGGNFMHIRNGLCVGWDSDFGPMPT